MKRFTGVIGALLLGLASAAAQAVPMSTLFDDGELQVGDKLFSDWTFLDASWSIDDWQPDFSLIDVTGDATDPMNIALNFDFGGQLQASDGEFGDLSFAFTASVVGGANQIVGVGLDIDVAILENGAAYIAEGVDTSWQTPTLEVDDLSPSDAAAIAGTGSVRIEKNVFVGTLSEGDSVNLLGMSQTFAQEPLEPPVNVPVPAPLALLALGLLGLGWSRRRA